MTHLRNYALYAFVIFGLLSQPSAAAGGEQRRSQTVTLRAIRVPYLSFAPFFIAEEEGYFTEQRLQMKFITMDRSVGAVPALVQGELDVLPAVMSLSFLNAIARGGKIKLVADKGYIAPRGCPHFALVARRALVEHGELRSPAHLKGRRIYADRASSSAYFLERLLKTAGLTLDDVEIVDVPLPAQLEAFKRGTMDGSVTGEPWVTRLVQTGNAVLWMAAQQVIPDFQFAFILYGPTLLEKNPDAGRRFMVAYLKAVRQYNQGKTERNLEILAKHTRLDRETLKQACWSAIRNDGRINASAVLDFQAWAVGKGFLDGPVKEEQFWDPRFVEYANQVLKTGTR